MKSVYVSFIYIFSSLIIASCIKESDSEKKSISDGSIGFTVEGTRESYFTRGTPLGNVTAIPNMGVYAYYTGNGTTNNWNTKGATATPNFLNGITVTQTSGAWNYTNKVYWPEAEDANVSFFAYSPVGTGGSGNGIEVTSTNGVPVLKYTVPTICTNQPDLLVADPKKDRNKTNNGSTPVNFSFKHALTSVGFKLAGQGEKVTSVKISGVSTTGTLSIDGTNINWTNLSNPTTTEFIAGTQSDIIMSDELTNIMSGNGYLMMIPQTLSSEAKLTVTFDGFPDIEVSLNSKVWAAGTKVIYELNIPVKIIYDANGGNGALTVQKVKKDEPATLESNTATPPSNKVLFHSWNTKSDGTGTTYTPGDQMTVTQNTTLYAIWMGVEKVGRFAGTLTKTTSGNTDTWQYDKVLEVLDMVSPKRVAWGPTDEATDIKDAIDGKGNTWALQQRGATNYPAANYCFGLNVPMPASKEKTEWYLPAYHQLLSVWTVNLATPTSLSNLNWSSTEHSSQYVWYVVLRNGDTGAAHLKNELYFVRCVREVVPK